MSPPARGGIALVALLCAACNHFGSSATVALPEEGTPARGFLVRGQAEDQRYGSYSYLLFAAPATHSSLAQYRAAAAAFLALDPARELRRYIRRGSCTSHTCRLRSGHRARCLRTEQLALIVYKLTTEEHRP